MNDKIKSDRKINKKRVGCSIVYFVISIILFSIFRRDIFYFAVPEDSWNVPRFIWCISSVSLGFSGVAFALRYHDRTPFPEYFTHYPFQLLAMATLVFSALHIFDATSGYLFYYLSFSLCFTMGFMVDRYWGFVESLIGKLNR